MKTALTIAGFDPSSGAGVTADLMVFAAHGVFGTACITSLTVQSTLGVSASHPVEARIVSATLGQLAADIQPDGIKVGMIASSDNALVISSFLTKLNVKHSDNNTFPVVMDTVFRSSSGRVLLNIAGVEAVREHLLPRVDWITPNLDELSVLSGGAVCGREEVPDACKALQSGILSKSGHRLGIIATGGHLPEPDDYLLLPNGNGHWLAGQHVETNSTHGTGCAFSSAFLCGLLAGKDPMDAAIAAKRYVAGALRTAPVVGTGCGPIKHLWTLMKP